MNKRYDSKNILVVFLTFVFVYIVLFEFILPVNKILPKPSLLFDSYISLWEDYNLLFASGITTTVVYLAILAGYIVVIIISKFMVKLFIETPGFFFAPRIFRYFPPFFFALLFIYWFGDSFVAELIFGFLFVVFILGLRFYKEVDNTRREYIDFARGLKIGKNTIYSSVIWKSCQPALFKEIKYLHVSLWTVIIIYEFIAASGLGGIYSLALNYNDFAAIFALGIMISLLILIGNFVFKFLKEKIIYWES